MSRVRDDRPWPDTVRTDNREELIAPATQIVADRDAYLGQGRHDVGRRVADDQVELFVTGEAAPSLQREFELQQPEFVAVHDVGTSASMRLLSSLAGAANAPVQRLTIRRQGYGMALAVLQFVEVPLADKTIVRVFSTDASADVPTRQALTRVLLAHSRLGVLITGEVPQHAVSAAFSPLREAIARGPWTNRELLLVPLGSSATLAAPAAQLSGGTPVAVQITPQAIKPKHIWTFIAGAWNRLNAPQGAKRAVETDLERALPRAATPASHAPTTPMPLQGPASAPSPAPSSTGLPMLFSSAPPPVPAGAPRAMPSPGATLWQGYAERCGAIKGAVACCVFDIHAGAPMASVGQVPSAERLATQGALLLAAAAESSRALGLGTGAIELLLSTPAHHVLLRPVPGHPGVVVHIVLQANASNATLAKMQLERIEAPA